MSGTQAHPPAARIQRGRLMTAAFARIDRAVGQCTDVAAVLVLIAGFVIVLMGVTSRYLVGTPLVWTEELATEPFLWLGMLGAAIALRRSEHMQVALLSKALSPAWNRRVTTVNTVAILLPAYDFVQNEQIMMSRVLGFRDSYRAAAVLVAMILCATNHQATVFWWLCNVHAFNAMPADLKDVLAKHPAGMKELESHGMVHIATDLPDMRKNLAPYYARWRQQFGEKPWTFLEQTCGQLG